MEIASVDIGRLGWLHQIHQGVVNVITAVVTTLINVLPDAASPLKVGKHSTCKN